MQVTIKYHDEESLTVEEVVRSAVHNYGKAVEVYYEFETYEDAAGATKYYLDKNYIAGFELGSTTNMQRHYGAIAKSNGTNDDSANKSIDLVVTKELLSSFLIFALAVVE